MSRTYLDYNATAPVRPEAIDAVSRALSIGGNPSSVHAAGRAARAVVEAARGAVGRLAGVDPDELVFTSGGTEANALAIESGAASGAVKRLLLSTVEHDSVAETARATGLPVEFVPVDGQGVVELDWLERRLAAWSTADGRPFLALMLANNETGVVQPVAEASRLIRGHDGLMHVDAVQAAGKISIELETLGADTLSLSGHKLGGPQGVGALALGRRAAVRRRMHGGGQERGLRGGTENVLGVNGFGAAADAALKDISGPDSPRASQSAWRDAAAERLKAAGALVAGERAPRLANTLCIATGGWVSALQVMSLDLDGVMVSAGSACSSGKVKPSGVLSAMGYGGLAEGALRASGGWATTEADWIRFADVWLAAHARHCAHHAPRRKEFA